MLYGVLQRINPVTGTIWHGVAEAGWIEPNRILFNHELIYFASGEGRIITGKGTFECRTGSMVILPPMLPHCTIVEHGKAERYCVHFDWEPANEIAGLPYVFTDNTQGIHDAVYNLTPEWVPLELPAHRITSDTARFSELLGRIVRFRDSDPFCEFRRKGLFIELLSVFFDDRRPEENIVQHSRTLLMGKGYIDTYYANPGLNVCKVAESCSVTENHLCKIFRSELNISPLEYLNQKRLEYAGKLLQSSSMTIAEIAFESGFASPNYFSRIFKKKNGVTPSAFATN